MNVLPCKAILFDCDGVLVDSDVSVMDAWARWADAMELAPDAVTAVVHGRRSEDTVAALIDPQRRDDALALIDRYEVEDAAAVTAIPGAPALLAAMPSDRWAVVTSGKRELALARLAAAGLPVPSVLVCADDVAAGKPDPSGYRAAATRLGWSPQDTIVLEDSASGIEAARAAGASAVVAVGDRDDLPSTEARVADLTQAHWTQSGLALD